MGPQKYVVIERHKTNYSDPIELKKGEKVKVGRKFEEDPEWDGWVWCILESGEERWVPEQYLSVTGNEGIITKYYSAKELSIPENEEILVLDILNGWAWSQTSSGEYGWIPMRNIKKI